MENLLYWVWLNERIGGDAPNFGILYREIGSAEAIYGLTDAEIDNLKEIKKPVRERLKNKDTDVSYKIIRQCQMLNIGILPYSDPLFPSRLRHIKNPPVLLFYKGRLYDFDKELCVGTVGTRHPTAYGSRCGYEIAFDLALSGACVVSGMAMGIDAICHQAALDAGGKTVAVLGCGVDVCYPKENKELYKNICLNGTIFSEYAPGVRAQTFTFPARNRIISGLSMGTLIVEAQQKSGAMITARRTKEQERDLFAVPGNLGEANSVGPNSLIRDGALAVTNARDILKEYQALYSDKINPSKLSNEKAAAKKRQGVANINEKFEETGENVTLPYSQYVNLPQADGEEETKKGAYVSEFPTLNESEKAICRAMTPGTPVTIDGLCMATDLSPSDVITELTLLEIKGIIKALPGGSYMLA